MNKKFNHYDIELRKNTKEFIAMENLLSELNSYGFHPDNFLAADNVCIDDRNRASYEMCRKIADTVRECHLPHI